MEAPKPALARTVAAPVAEARLRAQRAPARGNTLAGVARWVLLREVAAEVQPELLEEQERPHLGLVPQAAPSEPGPSELVRPSARRAMAAWAEQLLFRLR